MQRSHLTHLDKDSFFLDKGICIIYTKRKNQGVTLFGFGGYTKMTAESGKNQFSTYVIEVRYKEQGRIADNKGRIADAVVGSRDKLLTDWMLTNKANFTSKQNKFVKAFVSHTNFGFLSFYPNTADFFRTAAKEFVGTAWKECYPIQLVRVGVRVQVVTATSCPFKNLLRAYKGKFAKLTESDLEKFEGELVDVGFPMNFEVGGDGYNIMTGPMKKEQSKGFFPELEEDDLPDVGIYVDVDYFTKNFQKQSRVSHIYELIDKGVAKAREVNDLIISWVSEQE